MKYGAFDTEHTSTTIGCRDGMKRASKIRSSQGQVLVEFAFVLPLLLLIVLGVIEFSYLFHDQHILIRLTREGSNLISRDVTLSAAATAMTSMVNPPVDFTGANSKLIFTVLEKYNVIGDANYNFVIVYKRYEIGSLTAASAFKTLGTITSASFDPTSDYSALNPGTNTNLQVTNVPASLVLDLGQSIYVTEIYSRHTLITSFFNNLGVNLPSTLYSIAYF